MSFTKNIVILMGKVALKEDSAIELKESKGGTKYCTFPIVTDYSYKQGEEWKSRGIFHNIVVFGKEAEHCAAQLKKGSMVGITGEYIYDDSGDGEDKKRFYKVVAKDITFTAWEKGATAGSSTKTAAAAGQAASKPQTQSGSGDEEIPF